MIRTSGIFLLALPAVALLSAPLAQAQSYGAPPYYRGSPPPSVYSDQLPPPTRIAPDADEADALPPPGFVPPDARPSVYGHQLDPLPQRGGVPAAGYQPQGMRPPAAVGPAAAAPSAPQADAVPGTSVMTLPPEDQPETGNPKELPANLKRQLVDFNTREPAGTIVIDTPHTYLYLVLGHGKALRYGIGVGREGFTWAGTERVSKMKEWPDWFPPPEMIERQPYLPRVMAGGPGNPLGARALYLGHTLYRIHGTNQPSTIGQFVSSGCIRLLNEDIEDLYSRVQVGSRVVVLPSSQPQTAANGPVAGMPMQPTGATAPPNRGAPISTRPLLPVR
ncbi:MAG TPA: L,D-transpeptidase [Pseudolabrys sp.]|nr:L,D-transpeptidase [Pseudolabrys sp.]